MSLEMMSAPQELQRMDLASESLLQDGQNIVGPPERKPVLHVIENTVFTSDWGGGMTGSICEMVTCFQRLIQDQTEFSGNPECLVTPSVTPKQVESGGPLWFCRGIEARCLGVRR